MKCHSSRGAHSILITLTLITQGTLEDWKKKEREQQKTIAELERALAKSKGKAAKNREKKVHAEFQAKDASKHASKASEKSACIDDKLSKINSMYGAQGILNKPTVSESDSVSYTKNHLKGGSHAKKSRVEDTHPAHAESPHVKSGQRQTPEMLAHQGLYPTKTPPKKPTRQGSRSMERPSKSSFEQDLQASDLRRKIDARQIDARHSKPKVEISLRPFTHPPPWP